MRFNFAAVTALLCGIIVFLVHAEADYTTVVNTSRIYSDGLNARPAMTEISENSGRWEQFKHKFHLLWHSTDSELYIPLLTWHNRFTYSDEKIKSYNERPWGIGYGKYYFETKKDWHSVYAMTFLDSHNKIQPIIGYGYQKIWAPGEINKLRFGIGFTLSLTARQEYYYIPLPLLFPLFSVEYHRFSLQATYIPGTYNNGNVLFSWIRWQF